MPYTWVLYIFSLCSSDKNSEKSDGLCHSKPNKSITSYQPLTLILTFVACLTNDKTTKTVHIHFTVMKKTGWLKVKGTAGM